VPEFEKRWDRFSRPVGWSWRVDETYISVKGQWCYLYRAVDKEGRTIDFLLREDCGIAAAQAFFRKAFTTAATTLAGIELAHRIRKRQFICQAEDRRVPLDLRREWYAAIMV
jgi:hypothetical protein